MMPKQKLPPFTRSGPPAGGQQAIDKIVILKGEFGKGELTTCKEKIRGLFRFDIKENKNSGWFL